MRLKTFSALIVISVLLFLCPLAVNAQGISSNSESHILHLSEDLLGSWFERESRITHPVSATLIHIQKNSLDFYVDPNFETRAKSVIESSAQARQMTMRFLPESYVSNVTIYLLGDINQYFEAVNARGRAPAWAAGLAILQDGVILIRLNPTTASLIEPERTLAHELNHIALKRLAHNNPLPHWFYEGFAMLSTEQWNIHRAEILAHASLTARLLYFDKLTHSFPAKGAAVDLAYAQSSHFVSWIVKQFGEERFKAFLERIGKGEDFNTAFRAQYGVALSSVEMDWREGLIEKNSWLTPIITIGSIILFLGAIVVVALGIMRIKRRRRAQKHVEELPINSLPQNLRHFGPFNP